MKRIFFLLCAVAFLAPAVVWAEPLIVKGDKTTVSYFDPAIQSPLVMVVNPEVVRIGDLSFVYGDECRIRLGDSVVVVGLVDSEHVLLRYEPLSRPSPTLCPTGILFFVTDYVLIKWVSKTLHKEAGEVSSKAIWENPKYVKEVVRQLTEGK